MAVVKTIIEFFTAILSSINSIFDFRNKKKTSGIVIEKNVNTEVSGNQSNQINITIKENQDTKVSDNKWN